MGDSAYRMNPNEAMEARRRDFAGARIRVELLQSTCIARPRRPAVKAEETRLAALLSADRSVLGVPSVCTVRLLGQKAGASFVMADCKARDSSYSTYGPKRVDGSKVTKPGDGAAFSDTVREMFPEDLADFVLNNQDSPELRP